MSEGERPIPVPDQDSEPYWAAARKDELLIQRCRVCGLHQFYPRSLCAACGQGEPEWVPASGRGTIYSYTINHRPAGKWFADRVPYIVALIDLEEGPRLMANLDADPDDVSVGRAVSVWFEQIAPELSLPQFRLTDRPGSHDTSRADAP